MSDLLDLAQKAVGEAREGEAIEAFLTHQRDFEVKEVPMSAKEIDKDVNVLLLIHPRDPQPQTEYALDQFVIDGISDNVDFLSALMQHPRFRAGELTTGFIAEEYPEGDFRRGDPRFQRENFDANMRAAESVRNLAARPRSHAGTRKFNCNATGCSRPPTSSSARPATAAPRWSRSAPTTSA